VLNELASEKFGMSIDEVSKIVELLPKLALAGFAATYSAGFAIINLHLRRYGLFSPGLFKGEYILAGATWFLFLFVAYASIVSLGDDLTMVGSHLKAKRWIRAVGRIAFGLFYALYLPIWALRTFGSWLDWADARLWVAEAVILITPLALRWFRSALKAAWRDWRGSNTTLTHKSRYDLLQSGGSLAAMLVAYAGAIYPLVPPVCGGGRTQPVTVIVSKSSPEVTAAIAGTLGKGPGYLLVSESSEWIILGQTQGPPSEIPWAPKRAIRIRRSDVEAILPAPEAVPPKTSRR